MRLFVAVEPSPGFLAALTDLQERLRKAGITGGFSDPSGLHMTMAFIGQWPEDVTEVLPAVEEPFSVTLSHLGIFPEARVLWAGIRPCAELEKLAGQVRQNLEQAGIPFDPRPFNPHITLVRKPFIPEGVELSGIGVPAVSMIVDDVCLYRSAHREYTVIGRSRRE